MRRYELLKDLNTYCKSDLDKELGSVLTCTIIDFIEEVQQKEREKIIKMIEDTSFYDVNYGDTATHIITKIKKIR